MDSTWASCTSVRACCAGAASGVRSSWTRGHAGTSGILTSGRNVVCVRCALPIRYFVAYFVIIAGLIVYNGEAVTSGLSRGKDTDASCPCPPGESCSEGACRDDSSAASQTLLPSAKQGSVTSEASRATGPTTPATASASRKVAYSYAQLHEGDAHASDAGVSVNSAPQDVGGGHQGGDS